MICSIDTNFRFTIKISASRFEIEVGGGSLFTLLDSTLQPFPSSHPKADDAEWQIKNEKKSKQLQDEVFCLFPIHLRR